MRAVVPLLALAGASLLAGCSGAAAPAGPGIAARTAIAPEERSTCEALERVDLGLVGQDAASLTRSYRAMVEVVERSPDDLLVVARSLMSTYAGAASMPDRADDLLRRTGDRDHVIGWFNQRCGGMR